MFSESKVERKMADVQLDDDCIGKNLKFGFFPCFAEIQLFFFTYI